MEKDYRNIKLFEMTRGQRRKEKKRLRQNNRPRQETCEDCGGQKQWCFCCATWTKTCCVPYGTCMCS